MGLSPNPLFPENAPTEYQRQTAPDRPGQKGPLRFEEGIATDTDVPDDFRRGMTEGGRPAPGSTSHVDPETQFKHADETTRERAHVGSASWVDSPPFLQEFAGAAMKDYGDLEYEEVTRSGGPQARPAPTVVD